MQTLENFKNINFIFIIDAITPEIDSWESRIKRG